MEKHCKSVVSVLNVKLTCLSTAIPFIHTFFGHDIELFHNMSQNSSKINAYFSYIEMFLGDYNTSKLAFLFEEKKQK